MKPDPEPCSTCGRRRNCGKKSSKPGGRRWLSDRGTCCDRMNTTSGFTCSAMDTKASAGAATDFDTTTGVREGGAIAWSADATGAAGAAAADCASPHGFGKPSVEATARPKMNVIA